MITSSEEGHEPTAWDQQRAYIALASEAIIRARGGTLWPPQTELLVQDAREFIEQRVTLRNASDHFRLRSGFAEALHRTSALGSIEGFDLLRDLHRILFSRSTPPLSEQCEIPVSVGDVTTAAGRFKHRFNSGDQDSIYQELSLPISEAALAHGLRPDTLLRRELRPLYNGYAAGGRIAITTNLRLDMLYDGRRVRLRGYDHKPAISIESPGGMRHALGYVWGCRSGHWRVVAID